MPRAWPALVLAAGLVLAGCDGAHGDGEVQRFVAGGTAAGEVPADDILRGLSSDERVLACATGMVAGRSTFAPDWVRAHRLDLDADGDQDWLVEGRHACLSGADGADWWLYAEDDGGRRLLLAAGRARALEVLATRGHGFSELRLVRDDGRVAPARYDGEAYVVSAADGRLP